MRLSIVQLFVLLAFSHEGLSRPNWAGRGCGYQSCPKPKEGVINLHLVPHTHDDVGWLKTFDQYFYGLKSSIADAGVQYIIDTVIPALEENPSRRFIYVETAFFWKWWKQQDYNMRNRVKKLVNQGRLEFIGGAWSMNDEAATHYQSIIDQFTWGYKRLEDNFGQCGRPRIGWQIDPFGHSRQNANIMANLGFDALFLGRIDWEDRSYREDNKTLEMIWHTSANDDRDDSKLFTSVMYNTYSPPTNFCFDVVCGDAPIVDDPESPDYNADSRAADFLKQMRNYASVYRTNNIIVTMGGDFVYMDAHMNFKNMDKLIKQINAIQSDSSPFYAFYSTPSCYLNAVHNTGMSFPAKYDDFFPYSSDPTAMWSGYFTSRPTIKRFERLGNNYLQVCKQLHALSNQGEETVDNLTAMREAMGVMQHHDAVTGTERQLVADDYARILDEGIKKCDEITTRGISSLMGAAKTLPMETCLLLNISACPATETNDSFVVTLYNPLSRHVSPLVALPISSTKQGYSIKCPLGKEQTHQIVPISKAILNVPGRVSDAVANLYFVASSIPPLGFKSFYVSKTDKKSVEVSQPVSSSGTAMRLSLGKQSIKLNKDGILESVTAPGSGEIKFTTEFGYYVGAQGNNEIYDNRSSGAYILRPAGGLNSVPNPKSTVYSGSVVNEIQYQYNDWISSVVRNYNSDPVQMEFQWIVGPIPIDDGKGKEVVHRFIADNLINDGIFRTDSNGKEMLERRLNYRPTWPVQLAEPIPGNYYPVPTRISMKDESSSISIITDRSQGGTSLQNGTIELMVHRRLLSDDAFGVGEALNETAFCKGLVAVGTHIVSFTNEVDARIINQNTVLQPWLFFSPTRGLSFDDWRNSYKMEASALNDALPKNVQILTLESWNQPDTYILRLEHILEATDDPHYLSKPVEVSLNQLFSDWNVEMVTEMMLGANEKKSESKRFTWNEDYGIGAEKGAKDNQGDDDTYITQPITLEPMQIRTFIVRMRPKLTKNNVSLENYDSLPNKLDPLKLTLETNGVITDDVDVVLVD